MLLKISNNQLELVHEKKVLEKEVQNLVGNNLEKLFGWKFVDFEFNVDRKRIDILGWDEDSAAPVIIELKRENAEGLFDQGMEYFHLLSNRKNDFLIKLHEKLKIAADPSKVDWSSSKVIFIGRNFTQRQQRAVDFKGLPIELWDYDWYENNIFKIEQIGLEKKSKLEISGVGNNKSITKKVTREFKEYDRSWHEEYSSPQTWEIFEKIEETILSWNGVQEIYRGDYIAFKKRGKNFVCLKLQKSYVKIWISEVTKTISLKPRDVSNIGHYGTGKWEINLKNIQEVNEVLLLIQKNYDTLQ